ncbi:YceI family protein [Psychroflexus gondwanensis]|jgi:polyisoprenoid-binding protein YceI|uniref:YceI family protein n=1 Tax=Psychroflexus gondwanensis TaxID=251 RepID=UPI0011BF6E63|nr:YceI family protein [Psychroflexus gondwanensis]TXE18675.1 YceI family protein [Psychroflexus gondwanensis]
MKMNVLKGAFATTIILGLVAFTNTVEKKQVDVKESTIQWEGEKLTGSHSGTINLKDGFFLMEDGKLIGGEFTADMTSIDVTDLEGDNRKDLMGHLKSDDFFGVETHKTAKFVIKTVAKKGDVYGVSGDLTIKGNTNPIAFDLKMTENSATTNLSIDRTKYNVRYGSGSFFDNLGDKTIYDEFNLAINLKF